MSSTYASRRAFLRAAVGVAAAAPFVSRMSPVDAATGNFDPSFGTATEAVVALRDGVISSRELTQHVFTRIRKHNPKINAFVTLLEEQALAQARQSDEHRSRGQAAGPLHGVPILIKDTYETAGVRTTCGSRSLENYVPKQDAVVVARLKQAGAIIVGKTNVPEFASDHQSYNDVAGTTNNPWDVTRTPGGSTGGGAAALAAGLGFLEIGSDIAGSIRLPSHFCGVYGHKSTLDIVPQAGHIPPPPGVLPSPAVLPVAGPLARSAADLLFELGIVAGPTGDDARAYRWALPKPRKSSLSQYKVGVVLDDPYCPVGRRGGKGPGKCCSDAAQSRRGDDGRGGRGDSSLERPSRTISFCLARSSRLTRRRPRSTRCVRQSKAATVIGTTSARVRCTANGMRKISCAYGRRHCGATTSGISTPSSRRCVSSRRSSTITAPTSTLEKSPRPQASGHIST